MSQAAGISPDGWRRKSWVEAYLRVSAYIQAKEGDTQGTGSAAGDEEGAWIRALIFGQRAFLCARRLGLGRTRPVVDVGAGTGGAGLAALLSGAPEVLAYDQSEIDLDVGRRIHRAFGRGSWGRAKTLEPDGDVDWVWSFAWGEIPFAAESLRRWLAAKRGGGGHWWIVEPGTKKSAQGLARVRDKHFDRVVAPCPATKACPRAGGSDWCHFTWSLGFGPMASWILKAAGRDPRRLHCSFLHLVREPVRVQGSRLLQLRRGKVARLDFCGPRGPWRAEIPRRQKAILAKLTESRDSYPLVDTEGLWMEVKPGLWRAGEQAGLVSRGTL